MNSAYEIMQDHGGVPIRMWTQGVPVEPEAREQLRRLSRVPVVGPFVAVMPDVHLGIGATVGSVVPTRHAIIPAAVGVDIGCGMIAARTSLTAAAGRVGPGRALQGNLDPVTLLAGWPVVEPAARAVYDDGRSALAAGAAGHVFNLGHGVLPATDPGVLTELVSLVHSL